MAPRTGFTWMQTEPPSRRGRYLGVFSEPQVGRLLGQQLQVVDCQPLDRSSWIFLQVLQEELQLEGDVEETEFIM